MSALAPSKLLLHPAFGSMSPVPIPVPSCFSGVEAGRERDELAMIPVRLPED